MLFFLFVGEPPQAMATAEPPRSILYLSLFLLFVPPLLFSYPDSLDSLLGSLHSFRRQSPSPAIQIPAAQAVLSRLLPNHTRSFHFGFISEEECGGKACFLIANAELMQSLEGAEISIFGSSGVEILSGLYWYLKYWCGAHISWKRTGGVQLESVAKPGFLPLLNNSGVKIQRVVPWSYYQNVVTASYSSVWWDWKRWEEEIDWMALQGINLPLAFTGQEAIWQKVFEGFNLSRDDLNEFFGGPAFLAWARMGNLHGWGGPLQQAWIDKQLILQKKILNHMVQLGMTPVLPAFSGNVPDALRRVFPAANITQLGDWNTVDGDKRWCCTFLLDPNDNLFEEIGRSFVQQQIKEYGSITHVYNCDTFNENEPPTNDTSYIASLGAAVYNGMQAGDSEAVWLMQGWLFSSDSSFWRPPQMEALLHSVPAGKLIVLDLFAEVKPIWNVSSHFYGTPYIWCMLHNFGGNHEMYGVIDVIGSGPIEAQTSRNSTMVGVGMCMEGIEQNPVVYEMMAEMAFRTEMIDVEKWVKEYSLRRYGGTNSDAENAWMILLRTIYNCTDGIKNHNTDIISKFPNEDATSIELINVPGHLWYSVDDVHRALNDLLLASDFSGHLSTYRYDVVDLTRQVLAKYANQLYYEILSIYKSGTYEELRNKNNELLDLISDMESLLHSNDCFLLGNWLENAKTFGGDTDEGNMYEWNARTQVTMWFDNTIDKPSELHDYANKYWSGLVGDYYLPRVALYLDLLEKSFALNSTFPFEEWQMRWISLTNNWQSSTTVYPTEPKGDPIEIAIALSQKYQKLGKSLKYRPEPSQKSVFSSL